MLHTGLVSITFRQLTAKQVIELVTRAELQGIEWGGDIHVPHGDIQQARFVREMTIDAGLTVASYGSYYRSGHLESGPFEAVLESATELGATTIRVWAGNQGSDRADSAYHNLVVEDTQRIADLAAEAKVDIAYEFHGNTLTDTNGAARKLLIDVNRENVKSYWQPPRGSTVSYNLAGLSAVTPWLHHLHVFQWDRQTGERLPLTTGESDWLQYLAWVDEQVGERFVMLEFVKNDDPENFLKDAATLRRWIEGLQL